MNWVYLKSDKPADALALATVISYSNDSFGIVRRTINSFFFKGLKNVTIDFYSHLEDDNLIIIEDDDTDSWLTKCNRIVKKLDTNVFSPEKWYPYLGFTIKNENIIKQWGEVNRMLLYLFPHPDQKLDLMIVDQLVRQFEQKGVKSVSGGTTILPCINGTMDFRQLIDLSVLLSIKDRIYFMLTTEWSLKVLGEAVGIKVYVISQVSELLLNDNPMLDANQMVNYITKNNKKN